MTPITGGYLFNKRPLIRSTIHGHTGALDRPVSQLDLDAINAVQATPWRVNRWILDVMLEAWSNGQRIAGLEVGEPLSKPARLPDAVWEGMSPEDRSDHLKRLSELHATNASIEGRSRAILDALTVADELRDETAIWFPHTKDFRHRIYPAAVNGPNPQGNDICKALIMFAEGEPLGDDGEFWLMVRAANTFGKDKLPLEERVAWAIEHLPQMTEAATSPLTSLWWTEADEPWSFLATCFEMSLVSIASEPTLFRSHLPIPMDGTCNGLQHLAAMGLDTVGAVATNLASARERQDIYETVADAVRALVQEDVLAGVEEARSWHGKITRKVVKRAVMTTPYGVTDRGIRDQLINDGLVPDEGSKGEAAEYLKDKLVAALGSTVSSAKTIMAWLQVVADRLGKAGLPLDWTTPSGSKVRQAYHLTTMTRETTLSGKVTLFNEVREAGFNVRKQALGAAPNVIHSFDAAHLALTVAAGDELGIKAWAMVHDSYGTHAGKTTRLAALLREQFVAIYSQNWLEKLYQEVKSYAPHVDIPLPPERGTFDVTQVLDAAFFFS